MFPGINPKKMQAVMKQMGIAQSEISASRVIIEKRDNTKIIIDNPIVHLYMFIGIFDNAPGISLTKRGTKNPDKLFRN